MSMKNQLTLYDKDSLLRLFNRSSEMCVKHSSTSRICVNVLACPRV